MSQQLADLKAAYEGFRAQVTTGLATVGQDVTALLDKVGTLQTQMAAPDADAADILALAAEIAADAQAMQTSIANLHQQASGPAAPAGPAAGPAAG